MRSDSRGYALLDKLLSLFGTPEVGRVAARSLEIVSQDDPEVLSKANFSVIKVRLLLQLSAKAQFILAAV